MKLLLDLNTIDGYRSFLKVKSLPVHRFTGREAWFPDEYASRIGLSVGSASNVSFSPSPWLFDYQRDISSIAIRKKKYAVFAECGLGKTFIITEFARHCAEVLSKNRAVLIVSPPMVIQQTFSEVRRFYGNSLPIEQVRSAGLAEWLAQGKSRIGITNYEAISDRITNPGRLGALILDESSCMKSSYGKWGQRLIHLGRGLDWKLCATGTPAPNDRIEYANHAVFLDQFPTVNSFLAKFFINRGETSNRWELKPHALRPFYRSLSHWCIFLSDPSIYGWKDNIGKLPPIRTHILNVPMTDRQRDEAIATTGNLWGIPGGIGERQKVARIAKGESGNRPQFIVDLVNASPEPCLVWCKYNPEQDDLAERLPDAANVSGDTPEEKRIELITAFQNGEKNQLISKPKIMGFGLNLQRVRRMIFSTLQDSYEDYHQCVKRANRTGSEFPLDVFIPVTDIERPMVDTVLVKAARVDADTREQELLFKEVANVGF